ncbi:MAG: hypothetical protein BWY69_01293 [Planctomycetes bacterium ADurb.Bin401]|nr:MAG: hypothetical protein BWY69_01293 [Planctomycetes bacterium ADurb.Bin401]
MKHGRVSRLVNILTTLQSGEKYSPGDLEKLLNVSKRTVFRDLKELGAIGVPYRYDSKNGCYQIDPKFFLPPIDLSLQEALSLLIVVHKTRNTLPVPYKNSVLLAGMKIENHLPTDIRQYCQSSLAKITMFAEQHSQVKEFDSIYRTIQRAIVKKRIIKFAYSSLFEQRDISTTVHPYHLLYKKRAWYLVGFSRLHDSVRTFNIGRIGTIEVLEKCFTEGDNFDIEEYLGRAWSLIPEGRLYDVKLEFSQKVAKNVAEVQWHSTQRVQWNPDGTVILNFRVDGVSEISWWVLGYGDQVRVLSPGVLRKSVLQKAKRMIEANENL